MLVACTRVRGAEVMGVVKRRRGRQSWHRCIFVVVIVGVAFGMMMMEEAWVWKRASGDWEWG